MTPSTPPVQQTQEWEKRITEIASRVYDVDPEDPDPQRFAIEREIKELLEEAIEEKKRSIASQKQEVVEKVEKAKIYRFILNGKTQSFFKGSDILSALEKEGGE